MDLARRAEQGGVGLRDAPVRVARAGEGGRRNPQGSHPEPSGTKVGPDGEPRPVPGRLRHREIGELDVLLEERLAITVSRGEGPDLRDVEQSLEESSDLSRLGAGAILRALLYRVINDYASVVDGLGEDLAALEDDVLRGGGRVTGRMTNRLYELSRQVVRFQRATEHLEAVLEGLADLDSQDPGSNPELAKRLGGARSRVRWINSRVSGFTGLLQYLLSANLTLVSVQQNDQTRRISAWAAIIAVPTVIASIYGMNFRYMPELYLRFGYPVVVLVMVASCVVLYVIFKRFGWL